MGRLRLLPVALAISAPMLVLVPSGVAGGAGLEGPRPKLQIITKRARVDRSYHVRVWVRCDGPAGFVCIGEGWLKGGRNSFPITARRHYRLSAGHQRAVRLEISPFVRWLERSRAEHAGSAWVQAEFSNLRARQAIERGVLLHWRRLVPRR
jgi:hypothetical protein